MAYTLQDQKLDSKRIIFLRNEKKFERILFKNHSNDTSINI